MSCRLAEDTFSSYCSIYVYQTQTRAASVNVLWRFRLPSGHVKIYVTN